MINNYKDLDVWKLSMDLTEKVYILTRKLSKEEIYSLSNQIRRAVVSIPSNIAEGYNRNSRKEYIHFLYIAKGSNAEIETQLLLCNRLDYLNEKDTAEVLSLSTRIAKMLNALINKLEL